MKNFCLVIFTSIIIASCGGAEDHSQHGGPGGAGMMNKGSGATYQTVGVVKKVDLEKQTATVKHEDIKGYMDGMTMEFSVRDTAALATLKEGDTIEFWLETGEQAVIVEIKKLSQN